MTEDIRRLERASDKRKWTSQETGTAHIICNTGSASFQSYIDHFQGDNFATQGIAHDICWDIFKDIKLQNNEINHSQAVEYAFLRNEEIASQTSSSKNFLSSWYRAHIETDKILWELLEDGFGIHILNNTSVLYTACEW